MQNKSILLVLVVMVVMFGYGLTNVARSTTVTVSATVANSVTCNTNVGSTSFGTLTSGSVSTSTPNASSTMSCNYGLGCTLSLSDAGNGSNPGLATTSPANLIQSFTALLVAGTQGYGVQATTTATGSGATLGINSVYNKIGNNVGALSLTNVTLVSSTAVTSNREVVVTHAAAIAATTTAGSYVDTLTYTCTGN